MAKMFIGGESVDSVTKNTTEVRNPATGATVDTVPQGNDKDVQQAIQAAEDAFKVWSDVSAEDRKTGCGCIAEPHGSGFGLGLVLPILMTALRGHLPIIAVLSVVQVAAPFLLITFGEKHIASSLAGILVASAPITSCISPITRLY